MKDRLDKIIPLVSLIIFPVMLIFFIVLSNTNYQAYVRMLKEDHLIEYLTAGFLFLAGILSFRLAMKVRKLKILQGCFFVMFSLVCFLGTLEEISWGQRILHIESPEFFMENSDQQEINIHNVIQKIGEERQVFGVTFDLKTKHVAGFLLFIYGVCLPVLCLNRQVAHFINRIGFIVPPMVLTLGFLLGSLLMLDKPTGREEEIGEFFLAVCLFLFLVLKWRSLKKDLLAEEVVGGPPSSSDAFQA
jgi:hypothetical protein